MRIRQVRIWVGAPKYMDMHVNDTRRNDQTRDIHYLFGIGRGNGYRHLSDLPAGYSKVHFSINVIFWIDHIPSLEQEVIGLGCRVFCRHADQAEEQQCEGPEHGDFIGIAHNDFFA